MEIQFEDAERMPANQTRVDGCGRGEQLDAGAAGTLDIIDSALASKSGHDVNRFMEQEDTFGQLEYAALMRKIDKVDDSYRH